MEAICTYNTYIYICTQIIVSTYVYIYIYIYILCVYIYYVYIYIYTHPYTYVRSFSAKGIHDHLWLALGKPITWQMQWVSMPKNHSMVSCFHTSPSIGGTKISRSIGKHSIYHISWWFISNDTINIAYLLQYIYIYIYIYIHVYTYIYMPTTVLYTYLKTTQYRWI